MRERHLLAALTVFLFILIPILASGQTSKSKPEGEQTEPAKDDITTLMVLVGRLPDVDKDRRMEQIWENMGTSQSPRSDFLFCTGYAYLGNFKAQACLGNAYENGRGIRKDMADAYVWYSIALDNPINDAANRQRIQADRDRTKKMLLTGTPAKTEKDLELLVKAQKGLKMEYLAEIRNIRP